MRFFKHISDDGSLISVGTGFGGIEISENEYNSLMEELCEKFRLANSLYLGEITIDSIKVEWQDVIKRFVEERKAFYEIVTGGEISDSELADMLEEII